MAITPGQDILATDFINVSERDGTPANDVGRVAKLESDGKLSEKFLHYAVELTASRALSAGVPVGINTKGEIGLGGKGYSTDVTSAPSDLDGETLIQIISVDTNKYILLYTTTPSTKFLHVVACEIDSDNEGVTFGTVVTVLNNISGNSGGICKLDTNKFAVGYSQESINSAVVRVFTVSSLVITAQTITTLTGTPSNISTCTLCQLDTDKFAFAYHTSDTTADFSGFCTVSTYAITVVDSSTSALGASIQGDNFLVSTKIATDKFAIFSSEQGYCQVFTTVGSTFVAGTQLALGVNSASNTGQADIISISDDEFYVCNQDGTGRVTVSGTTPTKQTFTALENEGSNFFYDGTDLKCIIKSNTADIMDGIYNVDSSGAVAEFPLSPSLNTGQIVAITDGSNKVLAFSSVADTETQEYYSDGLTDGFIGFTESAIVKDLSGRVIFKGEVENQTGLLAGSYYKIEDGAVVLADGIDLTSGADNSIPVSPISAIDTTTLFI